MNHAITPTDRREPPPVVSNSRHVAYFDDCALPPAAFDPELEARAYRLADDAARSDIECYCEGLHDDHGKPWYDTDKLSGLDNGDRVFVDDALAYLDLRGLMWRDAERPHLVTFVQPVRECRICKCTDARACRGGCHWVADDLCSQCQRKAAQA